MGLGDQALGMRTLALDGVKSETMYSDEYSYSLCIRISRNAGEWKELGGARGFLCSEPLDGIDTYLAR